MLHKIIHLLFTSVVSSVLAIASKLFLEQTTTKISIKIQKRNKHAAAIGFTNLKIHFYLRFEESNDFCASHFKMKLYWVGALRQVVCAHVHKRATIEWDMNLASTSTKSIDVWLSIIVIPKRNSYFLAKIYLMLKFPFLSRTLVDS